MIKAILTCENMIRFMLIIKRFPQHLSAILKENTGIQLID